MKQVYARKQESSRDRVRSALGRLGHGIGWNHILGMAEGDDLVRLSLDAMASVLIDWRDLEPGPAQLDAVLAELGADDELVEATAKLIRIVGRAPYLVGLTEQRVRKAEELRKIIVSAVEDLVNKLEKGEDDGLDT